MNSTLNSFLEKKQMLRVMMRFTMIALLSMSLAHGELILSESGLSHYTVSREPPIFMLNQSNVLGLAQYRPEKCDVLMSDHIAYICEKQ